jgi:Phosphate-selective porin O and P
MRISIALSTICALAAQAGAQPGDPAPPPTPDAQEARLLDETLIKQGGQKPDKAKKPKWFMPKISGYLQVFYKKRFDTDDTSGVEPSLFRVGRARIRVSGKIASKVRYQVEVDPRAPDISGVMRDAFIEFRHLPYHKLRVGQQKTPWGYENGESSSRLYTVTRTELAEGIGRGLTLRDIGIAIKGRIPIAPQWDLEDHVALVNGEPMNTQVDTTTTKNVWGRLGARYRIPDQALTIRAGVSFGFGDFSEPDDPGPPAVPGFVQKFKRVGADVQVDTRWAFVVGEWARSTDEISVMPGEEETTMAWYVLIAGKTPWHAGPVVRYDTFDGEEFKRYTLGAYWGDIDASLRAMATYEIFEDEAGPHDHRLLLWTQVRI